MYHSTHALMQLWPPVERKYSADLQGAYGEVLLLRHVVKLLALDLRLRIRVFSSRGSQCQPRKKLIYNSLLWHLYTVSCLSCMSAWRGVNASNRTPPSALVLY